MITPEKMRTGGLNLTTLALWTGPEGKAGDPAGYVAGELAKLPFFTEAGIRQVRDPR